jgi:hypothetical protein
VTVGPESERDLVKAAVSLADTAKRFMDFIERIEKRVIKKLDEADAREREDKERRESHLNRRY